MFIGGSEVVLDCFDHVGFDVFLLLEGDGGTVDQLSVLVVGETRGARGLAGGLGDLGGEAGEGEAALEEGAQHE